LSKRAKKSGAADRITTMRQSMFAMPFSAGCFDVIWSEGAMYFMGLREGLTSWKSFLTMKGYIVVTEPCWLKSDVPDDVRACWREYPAMAAVDDCSRIIADAGYREVGHFTLPEAAWWHDYYEPIERKLPMLREKHKDNPGALTMINETQHEIDVYRAHSDCYGYVFFAAQRAT
jgi:hypothetical protein